MVSVSDLRTGFHSPIRYGTSCVTIDESVPFSLTYFAGSLCSGKESTHDSELSCCAVDKPSSTAWPSQECKALVMASNSTGTMIPKKSGLLFETWQFFGEVSDVEFSCSKPVSSSAERSAQHRPLIARENLLGVAERGGFSFGLIPGKWLESI